MKPNDMEMYGRAGASGAAVLSSRCSGQGSFAAAAYFQNWILEKAPNWNISRGRSEPHFYSIPV